jgi:hypothetical protein
MLGSGAKAKLTCLLSVHRAEEERFCKDGVVAFVTWLPLRLVRGKLEFDGLERVSSQTILDMLEVPQRSRTASYSRACGFTQAIFCRLGQTTLLARFLSRACGW